MNNKGRDTPLPILYNSGAGIPPSIIHYSIFIIHYSFATKTEHIVMMRSVFYISTSKVVFIIFDATIIAARDVITTICSSVKYSFSSSICSS